MRPAWRIAGGLLRRSTGLVDRVRLKASTRLLHGPARIHLRDDQVMVVALVRDAAYFIEPFLDHHFSLGVAHVLVVDNGSVDATVEVARAHERVTVLQNRMPAKRYETVLRRQLACSVAGGGWLLFADADELVEPPAPLADLTRYCGSRGFTALLGQMLDRFSDLPYGELRGLSYRQAIAAMNLYSLKQVESLDYDDPVALPFGGFMEGNTISDPRGRLKRGGIRQELFGETPFLTKHSLVRNQPGLVSMSHPHCASGVAVGDVSLLLHHYKLAGDWIGRERRTLEGGHWAHGEGAQRLASVVDRLGSDMRLAPSEPRSWRGIAALQDEGFLYASDAFRAELASGHPG